MTYTINPEKLALLDELELQQGSHPSFDDGHCAMEVVSWLADLGHTDAPACASPVLTRYTIRLNDRWSHEKRQALKPYLPRMVGTAGDGKDPIREQIAARYVAGLLVPWLRLAGLNEDADRVEVFEGADMVELRRLLRAALDAAWALRSQRYTKIREAVKAELAKRQQPAVAVAVAVAAAVAAADAVAVAAAVAAAAAAADAVAAADADADADADAAPGYAYSAAYKAARDYYRANPLPIAQEVADLAASQEGVALDLLDKLIRAEP